MLVGSRHPTHPMMQLAQKRERDALELRLKGYTYAQISDAMGLSIEGARQAVIRALAEIKTDKAESAQEVREQEAARLDRMLQTLERMAEATDDASTLLAIQDRLLKVQDRRARLLGLDLQRVEVTGAGGGPIAITAIQRVIVDPTTQTIDVTPEIPSLPASTDAVRVDSDASSESCVDSIAYVRDSEG